MSSIVETNREERARWRKRLSSSYSDPCREVSDAREFIARLLDELEQYVAQLQQLEDMVRNTAAPAMYVWAEAQSYMNKIQGLQNKVDTLMSSGSSGFGCTEWPNIRQNHNRFHGCNRNTGGRI